jgi:hypothetical protein
MWHLRHRRYGVGVLPAKLVTAVQDEAMTGRARKLLAQVSIQCGTCVTEWLVCRGSCLPSW